MKRLFKWLLAWVMIPAGFASLGWVARGSASEPGDGVPVRITPSVEDLRRSPATQRAVEWMEGICEPFTRQPPAIPADCREPLHGRTKTGGDGPENDELRGEM